MRHYNTPYNRIAIQVLAGFVLLIALCMLMWFVILPDAVWCIEQWGVHGKAAHCMVVEGTLTGRLFTPQLPPLG